MLLPSAVGIIAIADVLPFAVGTGAIVVELSADILPCAVSGVGVIRPFPIVVIVLEAVIVTRICRVLAFTKVDVLSQIAQCAGLVALIGAVFGGPLLGEFMAECVRHAISELVVAVLPVDELAIF